ncbi:hypothetical protein LMG27198_46000 [Methylocystis echinoides]|uniref:Uncharacterized protein n=1 Tax=Methylocystis echinoides TaxID=29468 RepID=A0A9W6GYU3_9HYPH|nr:hypothetical protein LMG27198_46000 [Methylocystis echinoides]
MIQSFYRPVGKRASWRVRALSVRALRKLQAVDAMDSMQAQKRINREWTRRRRLRLQSWAADPPASLASSGFTNWAWTPFLIESAEQLGGLQKLSPYLNSWAPGFSNMTGQDIARSL